MTDTNGIPARSIDQRQLDPEMVTLQRAASVVHRDGQRIEALRAAIAVVFAVGGVAVTALNAGRVNLALFGFAWFLVSATAVRSLAGRRAADGATIQEQFDCALFGLPWNHAATGDQIPADKVSAFARRMKVGSERDLRITNGWYDPTTGIHYPYDVLTAQEQNLRWDARLRRRYATMLVVLGAVWALGGVTTAVVQHAGVVGTLVGFFVPSAAAYQLGVEIVIGQRRVATERERLARMVRDELASAKPGPIPDATRQHVQTATRNIQDGILRTRLDVSRVPELVYRHFRGGDEQDFAQVADDHARRLRSP